MRGILSNGLSLLAEATPPVASAEPSADMLQALFVPLAAGVVLLGIGLVRLIANPKVLSLRGAPPRPNRVHPILPIAIFLFVIFVAAPLNLLLQSRLGNDRSFILIALVTNVGILALSLVAAAKLFAGGLRGCGLTMRFWRADTVRAAAAWIISLPVCFGLLLLTIWLIRAVAPEHADKLIQPHGMLEVLERVSTPWRVGVFISAVVLAPIGEELLFRGLVQSSIRQYTQRPWLAVGIASALFAIAHGEQHGWPALMALSMIMGYNYERTGRLTSPILIHALFNATNLLVTP